MSEIKKASKSIVKTYYNFVSVPVETMEIKKYSSCCNMTMLIAKADSPNNLYNKNDLDYYIPKNNENKLKLNILYYDESLLENMNQSEYCAYLQMNINGTFYGCHNMHLLDLIIEKIKKSDREFILISSGSSAEKVYNKIQEWTLC